MSNTQTRAFQITGTVSSIREVIRVFGTDCMINVYGDDYIFTYTTPVNLNRIPHLHPEKTEPPRLSAPLHTVLRDNWLTPNDQDTSDWETRPLTGRITITPGVCHRIKRDYPHKYLEIRAGKHVYKGIPDDVLDEMDGTYTDIIISKLDKYHRQTSIRDFFSYKWRDGQRD